VIEFPRVFRGELSWEHKSTLIVDIDLFISYIIMLEIVRYLQCDVYKPVRRYLSRLCCSFQIGCYRAVLHKILQVGSELHKSFVPETST